MKQRDADHPGPAVTCPHLHVPWTPADTVGDHSSSYISRYLMFFNKTFDTFDYRGKIHTTQN